MLQSKTGAAANRRMSNKDPMRVVFEIWENDPTLNFERQLALFRKEIRADLELTDAVERYAFTNYHSQLERQRVTIRKSKGRMRADRQAEKRLVRDMVLRVAKVAYLELEMPNGKKLRDCTFADCGAFGGFYKRLAVKGKPSELVGKKMTDENIRSIFAGGK